MKKYKCSNNMITFCVSEICNIKCIFCYQCESLYDIKGKNSFLSKEEYKFMTFDVFKKVFDNLDCEFDEIDLTGFGEPMLNPDLFEIIKYFLENNNGTFKRFFLSTNAVVFDKEKADILIDLLKSHDIQAQILFSINAASSSVYDDVCGKGEAYEKVVENAKYFIRRSHDEKISNRIFSSVQMVVVKENAHEVGRFYNEWQSFFRENGFDFALESACACGETMVSPETPHTIAYIKAILANQHSSSLLYDDAMKGAGLDKMVDQDLEESTRLECDHLDIKDYNIRKPCSALWKVPVVGVEGDLSICSRDLAGNYTVGNVQDDVFSAIYYGNEMNNIRKQHMLGNFRCPDICFDCNGFEGAPVSEEELKEYVNMFEDEALWKFYNKRQRDKVLFDLTGISLKDKKTFYEFLEENDLDEWMIEFKSDNKDERLYYLKDEKMPDPYPQQTFLPCFWLTSFYRFEENGIFCGCKKIKVDVKRYSKGIKKMFSGDNSMLPKTCIDCKDRFMPPSYIYYKHRDYLNRFWHQFYLEQEVFLRNLPDFNIEEFGDEFLKKNASDFRESYIRFIMKYDKFIDRLTPLYEYLKDCNDPYILLLLARGFLYGLVIDKAFVLIDKLKIILPSEYVELCFDIVKRLREGKKISSIIDDRFLEYDKELLLLNFSLRYAQIKGLMYEE